MPTKRTWSLLTIAGVVYFLADQTQVGWLYLISDGLVALLIAAFFYTWGMLKSVQARRFWRSVSPDFSATPPNKTGSQADDLSLTIPTFHEDDQVEITLRFQQHGLRPALLVGGQETCPFAPAGGQMQTLFMPTLFKNQPVDLTYQTTCDRRGLYHFADVPLHSRGPFGLFSTRRKLAVPGEILIYPQYYPLKRLRLLETKGFSQKHAQRTGLSGEFIGTREYRPGDSLRQIHWRSTARIGKLIVKEFTDDDQLTLTTVLDLQAGENITPDKFSPFETAIRLAASFSYYAGKKNIPFRLIGASPRWKPPQTPLSWEATLNYLAKVNNDGHQPLAEVLSHLPVLPFVVVLVSHPNEATLQALNTLARQGTQTLAFVITPEGTAPALPAKTKGLDIITVQPKIWSEVLVEV